MKKLGRFVLVLVPVCVLLPFVSCGNPGDQKDQAGAHYQTQREVLVSSLPQVCGDGLDNDGDTFTDFPDDAGCLSLLDNNEITDCQDGVDNDGDTTIDLSDPGCIDANDLSELGGECDDWLDNDGDGLYDMADPGCSDLSDTNEQDAAVECDDGADNDGDTLTDLIDPGCRNSADASEYLGTVCDNGLDDDGDTFMDYPADAGCLSLFDNREITDCQDGVDNDGDTNIDFPTDTGCTSVNDTMELSVVYECWDGIDNDGDTLRDYPSDPGCATASSYSEMGGLSQVASYCMAGDAYAVYVSGNYAYIVDVGNGLVIVNISDPLNPIYTGFVDFPGWNYNVFVSGSYAYIASPNYGLYVIDISVPSSPMQIGFYSATFARAVHVSGNYAYVAIENNGLLILDVSTPSSPSFVSSIDTPGNAINLFVIGDYVYVADGSSLQVVDISIPSSPEIVGSLPGTMFDIFVRENYAYVGSYTSGLKIIDVTDPANPALISSTDTPVKARAVFVNGDYAFVADMEGGLQVIDISDPFAPEFFGSYFSTERVWDVFVSGNYAYVVTYYGCGLNVIYLDDINDCNDDMDNDADTFTDFPEDPECISPADSTEGLYVHVWGTSPSPSEDGSVSNPFKTIQEGISVTMPGKTVLVAQDIYAENVVLKPGVNLMGGYNSTFSSRDPDINRTIINPSANTAVSGTGFNATVDGFEITNASFGFFLNHSSPTISNSYIHDITNRGIHISGSGNPYISDNTIINTGFNGIFIYGSYEQIYPTIKYNTIDVSGNGITLYTHYDGYNIASISNTWISGHSGSGIKIDGYAFSGYSVVVGVNTLKNSIIANSNIAVNLYDLGSWGATGLLYVEMENTTIANNNQGLTKWGGYYLPSSNTIRNSIFASNTNWHIQPSISATLDISYSNFWEPALCNCTPGPGVQFVDPLFNPDFTLQPASPIIDAGDPNASYDDAIPPGQGAVRNDMGAFGGPGASGIVGTRTPFSP